jgi:hypothetical protein
LPNCSAKQKLPKLYQIAKEILALKEQQNTHYEMNSSQETSQIFGKGAPCLIGVFVRPLSGSGV